MSKRGRDEREDDLLAIGERVLFISSPFVHEAEVVHVSAPYDLYGDGRKMLAPTYKVKRVHGVTNNPDWSTRASLFRLSERHELIAQLEEDIDTIEYHIAEVRNDLEDEADARMAAEQSKD